MASVFTFDPDPPRVESPWSTPPVTTPQLLANEEVYKFGGLISPQPILLADCGLTKLEAEPQDGPTEYKLHLLLRPRRNFSTSSTGTFISGSHQSKSKAPRPDDGVAIKAATSPLPIPSFQARQNRLQHLTTQLLWRLQQSSPYHSSSAVNLVLPVLPETALKLGNPLKPGKLLPGLEESRGALYEIGVSDDGTFVGLQKDELDESLINLRSMAASLGCRVEILRTVIVGHCEWFQIPASAGNSHAEVSKEELWVAEVLVIPNMLHHQGDHLHNTPLARAENLDRPAFHASNIKAGQGSSTEQLRISLTGSTTSGKSSLLGTLSTSTLDNGRGKSRLSLLKHRHEIATGVTSSVAPELIGYHTNSSGGMHEKRSKTVVNYGCGNVSSWNDIHNAVEGGRLVFISDSAGHPRYRRTTFRGLISWDPHWTLCCIASDDCEDNSSQLGSTASARDVLGPANAAVDLSKAHLELCLKLGLSLVVVITKYDIASRAGLRQALAKVLSVIKAANRRPVVLSPCPTPGQDLNLQKIQRSHEDEIAAMFDHSSGNTNLLVPIVITSAVTGSGMDKLHALLSLLPIPKAETRLLPSLVHYGTDVPLPAMVFHIDEVFSRPSLGTSSSVYENTKLGGQSMFILSGHLRYGKLALGEKICIGPFTTDPVSEDPRTDMHHRARSYPGQRSVSTLATSTPPRRRPISGDYSEVDPRFMTRIPIFREWQYVHIKSIRNLRLPVQTLLAGQVGTVVIEFCNVSMSSSLKIRKGMILGRPKDGEDLQACNGFRALFDDKDYLAMEPGQLYSVYIASIRASAKIVSVEIASSTTSSEGGFAEEQDDVFGFEDGGCAGDGVGSCTGAGGVQVEEEKKLIEVAFMFVTQREWVEVGTQVFVMPGSGIEGSTGLEGFVGRVTEILE
jgi:GTPase